MKIKSKKTKELWTINPKSTALVVIDMQRAFIEKVAPFECPGAIDLVPKINNLAATCRKMKIPVIFVKQNRWADGSNGGLLNDFNPIPPDCEKWALEGKKGVGCYPWTP